jgi:general stress protein 26
MSNQQKKSNHPQAPPFADQHEIEGFLARPLLARFCTHNQDGTIHIAPLYYIYSDGEFLLGTQDQSRRVKNIRRDNRVSLLIDSSDPVTQAVMVYGDAALDYDDVLAKRVKILDR